MRLCSIIGHKWSVWKWGEVPHRWCLRCRDVEFHPIIKAAVKHALEPKP